MPEMFFDQNQYNTVRAEIWKVAADKSFSKENLIRELLLIVGRFLNITQASYFEMSENGNDVECKVQWCSSGTQSYCGEKTPVSLSRELLKSSTDPVIQLSAQNLPPGIRRTAGEYLNRHGIKSLFLMPIDREQLSYFSFSDNRQERQWSDAEISIVGEMINIVSMRMDQIKTETEKSFLENQLRHTQTLEAIGQLAGGIAHDFNNILGAISGYAEMIKQKFSKDNPKLEKYSTAILSGAHKGADLTAQLLAFARRGRFQKVCMNMHELISHVSLLLQNSLDQSIKVVLDLRAKAPYITGDPTQMQNILLNLAMNARDAMPEGGTLTLATENGELHEMLAKSHAEAPTGPYVIVSVTDTGVGMDQRTKEKLFEPFFTTKDIGKGVGLGLASVYGSVTSHEGYISVDSDIGRGSTITLYLPVDKNAVLRFQGNGNITHGNGTVVVIDNDEPIRSVYREMLSEMGYTVVEFTGAAPAIEYYRTHWKAVDLVITDMIMEGLNGMVCFRELKKINPSVKTVLSSGYSFSAEKQDILNEGIAGVMQKPFDSIQLSHVVAEALGKTVFSPR
jgi:signal transduction histidine kinase/ActR/RegA family two-component response regulator